MLQGTGSDVGKSVITAALCRIARRRGLSVAPFKPQNMSNNAAACPGGGEIGRAQALQAMAAGLPLSVDFNPVLLKPQSDQTSQVVVHGDVVDTMEARDFLAGRQYLMDAVMESFGRLGSRHDLILVEGAGSPAEINLRERDIANMGFARKAGVPVCLIGDIEKGGVIASLVGTQAVIDPSDSAHIRYFMVNKFRGNLRLFDDGVRAIEARTGWPCLGVIPWLRAPHRLPAEDAVDLQTSHPANSRPLTIAAPMLSRLANFDDADPLKLEPGVSFHWVPPGQSIPRDTDVVILFGSKSTRADLEFLKTQGWDHDIIAHARAGGRVLGLCGGYQMLGQRIVDRDGVDGEAGESSGLGLLDVTTTMSRSKRVTPSTASCALTGADISGYEIHVGETHGADTARPMFTLHNSSDGARSANGQIEGSYLHGVFGNDRFRQQWLERVGGHGDHTLSYSDAVDTALDELADGVEDAIDVDRLFNSAEPPGWSP